MKKNIWIAIAVIIISFITYIGYVLLTTKSHSPFKETTTSFEGTEVTVAYCQPFKKGRKIFGSESEEALQAYGKYWRLGANEATIITFSSDVLFAGKNVKAGTYVMYAVPGKEAFDVSLNTEVGRWGATEVDHALDVVTISAPTSSSDTESEQFTINFSEEAAGLVMTFEWGKVIVSIPITK